MSEAVRISEEDEEFEPMSEAYNNPEFNSYKSGPGSFIHPSLHTQKGWVEKGQNYKLFVAGIPLGIKKDGLMNIFSNFGVPVRVHIPVPKNNTNKFGFIEYRTLREAERAIYSVNNVPPLNLSVKFAHSDEAKQNRNEWQFKTPMSTLENLPQPDIQTEDRKDVGRGRGQLLTGFKGIKPDEMVSTYEWYTPYMSLYSKPLLTHSPGEFNISMGDEIVDVYNEALTFEKPVVTNNERSLIYMGRGYALKSLIDHTERYISPLQKVYSFSNESETFSYQTKPCFVCCEEALRICFNCRCWYCSKNCFRNDSPNHTINPSGLVVCYNVRELSEVKSEDGSPPSNKHLKSAPGIFVKKLIFPPQNNETQDKEGEHIDALTNNAQGKQTYIVANRNSHLKNCHHIRNSIELESVKDYCLSSPNMSEKCDLESEKDNKSSAESELPDDDPLPSHSYTEVMIIKAVDELCYWVNKKSDKDQVFNIMKSLFSYCKSSKAKQLSEFNPDCICAALLNKFWYRAKILSSDGKSVKVHLIDYGQDETCSLNCLKILPKDKFDTPPLAFKIRFANGTPKKYETLIESDVVSVKPAFLENDGTLIVRVEKENYPENVLSLPSADGMSSSSVEKDEPLSFNSYSDVMVAFAVNQFEYYVNLCSLWDVLTEMSEILYLIAEKRQPVTNPVVGDICIRSYQSIWCRAKVTSLSPLTIFYIDYGNEEEIASYNGELRALPPSMSTNWFPAMAVKIKMEEGTSTAYLSSIQPSMKLNIKAMYMDGETYIVKAKEEDFSPKESNSSLEKSSQLSINEYIKDSGLNHLLPVTELCKHFYIIVNQVMSKDRICGSLDLNPGFVHLSSKAIEDEISDSDSSLSPDQVNLGDFIGCLTSEGVCARGYITSIIEETRRVALVDLGYVSIADKLCQIPSSLKSVPEAAITCTFARPHNNIQMGFKMHCRNAKLVDNEVHCEVKGYGPCILSLWKPRVEDGGLACISIQSGSKVTISSYLTPQAIYIQSSEPKHKELLDTLLQDVATYAQTASPLNREPEIGEVIVCLFPEDQNFYRAQVHRRRGHLFSVVYIDFGNSFDVDPSDMRILCDSLKMVPCCALKIGLKGVNENIFNTEAVNFLNLKCSKNESLYLEYEDSLNNSVLKTKEGLRINDKIYNLIRSHWKKCLDEEVDPTNGEVFFGDDVKYMKWDINSQVKLLIITQVEANSYLVINTQDGLFDFMRDLVTPRISEYCCSFAKNYQYTPRIREICFVRMQDDDKWYRALCTNTFDISCWVVLLDFGNTGEVYYKNVRPMTYEFIQFPSILKKCTVMGLPEKYPNDDVKKKLSEVIVPGSVYDAVVIEELNQGVVTAYFNKVAEIAPEIGLPPIQRPN